MVEVPLEMVVMMVLQMMVVVMVPQMMVEMMDLLMVVQLQMLVEGQLLIDKGLPKLALAWTTNAIDFSPLGLFGKLSVAVGDLYKHVEKVNKGNYNELSPEKLLALKKAQAKAEASNRQKEAVAEYFINEMYLGAEMCMDRN